jgi:hypothetical protein
LAPCNGLRGACSRARKSCSLQRLPIMDDEFLLILRVFFVRRSSARLRRSTVSVRPSRSRSQR